MRDVIIEQFNRIAQTYDSERRFLIPCFDDFYKIIVELTDIKKTDLKIIDIGAGTGLLSQFLMIKYPDAEYTLIDISEDMLSMARSRFKNKNNIKYIIADYSEFDFKEKYDLAVSALSIHHLTHEEKEKLYSAVYKFLLPGGIFINGDQFLSPHENNEKIILNNWFQKIESTQLSEERKKGAYERMKMDKTATLEENLNWLKKSGFSDVEIFYKYFNFGIIYGRKG